MVWFLAIIYLVQVVVLAIQFRVNKHYRGVGWWLLWSLAEALGFFFLSLRELNNPFLIFLQNMFLFSGTVFMYIGIRSFFGMPPNRSLLVAVTSVFTLLLVFLLNVYNNTELRGGLVNLFTGLMGALAAWVLFTGRPSSIRFSANFTAIILSLHTVFMFISGILKMLGHTPGNPIISNPINYITLIDAMMISLMVTFGFIIMLNHRLNASLSESVSDLSEAEARDRELLAALEKSNSEKDTFYSVLAHDLRSPFNSLLGFTNILKEDFATLEPTEITRINATVQHSAEKLYNLVESLLEWSRTQRGVIPFEPEPLELGHETEPVILPLRGMMEAKSISLRTDVPGSLSVFADKHMLETILRNLLVNSIKFTEKGGQITVSAGRAEEGMVQVTVTDTGIGMKPGMASKVFSLDPDNTRPGTSGETGTGLGLIICNEFVKKLGGRIWLESAEGKGSSFCFTVPAST